MALTLVACDSVRCSTTESRLERVNMNDRVRHVYDVPKHLKISTRKLFFFVCWGLWVHWLVYVFA